jgi:HAD superfamily hydrolase (TIGR01484 family)
MRPGTVAQRGASPWVMVDQAAWVMRQAVIRQKKRSTAHSQRLMAERMRTSKELFMADLKRDGKNDTKGHDGCKWQERLDELFHQNPARLRHMRDAASVAQDVADLGGVAPDVCRQLETAALAHDLGYAPQLQRTGYHPLDGALFLEECGEDPLVVEAVLRHSRAGLRSDLPPAVQQVYGQRPPRPEATWLVDAVTWCDWRAAGIGGRVGLGARLQDILQRHSGDEAKARRARALVAAVRAYAAGMIDRRGLPWVVCDIDNTLLFPGGELPSAVFQSLARYQSCGGRISLASGKHPLSTLAHARDWGLDGWHVAANGTCAVRQGRVEVVAHLEEAEPLVEALSSQGLGLAVYRVGGIEPRGAWQEEYSAAFARYGELRPQGERLPGPVLKILAVLDAQCQEAEARLRRTVQEAGCTVCRSDRHFLEILPSGCGKGTAAAWIFAQEGWPLLASLAVGDNENDAQMFHLCGLAAVVDNAPQEVAALADVRIPPCAAGGVGALLDTLREAGVRGAVQRWVAP